MLPSCARASALALAIIASACGDDEVVPDGGNPADAAVDAAAADAALDAGDDLCPGQLTFEALVADAESSESVFEVDVAEVDAANQTQSAPNGRAVLCLPLDRVSEVRSTLADYLARTDTLDVDAVQQSLGTDQPYPIDVMSTAAADLLLSDLGPDRDPAATLLLVSVVSYPDAQPLVGATVTIDEASGGAFARGTAGDFAPSPDAAIGDGRLLLLANVVDGDDDGRAVITVAPPDGFSGVCVGPPSVALQEGGLSGAFFACQ
ncbi:MAG TPA: hypothetical protein VK698_02910 [Kofleriaceae bacterium]|nr:hypothetical protein [Kofleriaceae bacterium]